jgi:hypothetical protein
LLFECSTTPLKSASLLKNLSQHDLLKNLSNACNSLDDSGNSSGGDNAGNVGTSSRKRSFTTQRTIFIGGGSGGSEAKFRSKSTDHGTGFKIESLATATTNSPFMDLDSSDSSSTRDVIQQF